MTDFFDKKENILSSDYYNFGVEAPETKITKILQNNQSENLNDIKKYMADELLEKLRKNDNVLYKLEAVGYTEEILMNMLLKYYEYSGLDLLSCIYVIETAENNKESYLEDNGPQKKKV